MEGIRDVHGLTYVPRPCEHFDLIGGTSTGGYLYRSYIILGLSTDIIQESSLLC